MRRASDPAQGSLFAAGAEPETRGGTDPQIPMANHAFERHDARPTAAAAAVGRCPAPAPSA
jgi:hypothetical protein